MRIIRGESRSSHSKDVDKGRYGTRSAHASQACERCRRRKQRCTGTRPTCENCSRSKLPCRYSQDPDRRSLVLGWRQENSVLLQRIECLERYISKSHAGASCIPHFSYPRQTSDIQRYHRLGTYQPQAYFGPTEGELVTTSFFDEKSADFEPFGAGSLALDSRGKLHLTAEATFYRPGDFPTRRHSMQDWSGSNEGNMSFSRANSALSQSREVELQHSPPFSTAGNAANWAEPFAQAISFKVEPHHAPYLPYPLDKQRHATLLHLFFSFTPTFGMNSFREQFQIQMEENCMDKQTYFSPLLHMVALAIGSRYDTDRTYHSRLPSYCERGKLFYECGRRIMGEESEAPSLATIIGLIMMSIYSFGMMNDQAATNFYAIAVFLTQEFRLHRRCDEQLRALGKAPDGELDQARRDVYGLVHNFSSWWMNYFARMSLDFSMEADQRKPFERCENATIKVISKAFRYHCSLSEIGHEVVFCHHSWRTAPADRLEYARKLSKSLAQWRQSLPAELRWPQTSDAAMMPPGVVAMLAMYNAYVIELHRPYIPQSSEYGAWSETMDICVVAAEEMIELFRYIRDFHGVRSAPLTMQQMIHVTGTMLILLASGLGTPPNSVVAQAHRNLLYLFRWLDEFSEIWPAASQTAESLRKLKEEHCF